MNNQNLIRHGNKENLPAISHLRAGAFSVIYENGFLRYLRLGNRTLLLMINHAVRDQNWNTIPFIIEDEALKTTTDSFSITYRAEVDHQNIRMTWKCLIEGHADSRITFTLDGDVKSDFLKNRTGFTVLHPIAESIGNPVEIVHSSGEKESLTFPVLIAPHQPFKDISEMRWQADQESTAVMKFSGDVFETEDQRNWIDASFKTYCTPLSKPFPVQLRKGDRIHQRITVSLEGKSPIWTEQNTDLQITLADQESPLPKLGIGKAPHLLSPDAVAKIKALQADHYRCAVAVSGDNWIRLLKESSEEANDLGLPMELVLTFPESAVSSDFVNEVLGHISAPVSAITLLTASKPVSDDRLMTTVTPLLRTAGVKHVGGGTDAFFTELNRNRIKNTMVDFLSWSINPQVHAFDNRTLTENLQALTDMIATARHFGQEKSLHISPITLRMRWNPNATATQDDGDDNADPRQASLFGASWTLGCIKYLGEAGAEWLTFYETTGRKGLINGDKPSHCWADVGLDTGDLFPVWHALKWVTEFKGSSIVSTQSSAPLTVDALLLARKDQQRLILFNFSNDEISVKIDPRLTMKYMSLLDETSYHQAAKDENYFSRHRIAVGPAEITLPPYGLACLDQR